MLATAIQTALDLKSNLASPIFIDYVTATTPITTTNAVTKGCADALSTQLVAIADETLGGHRGVVLDALGRAAAAQVVKTTQIETDL